MENFPLLVDKSYSELELSKIYDEFLSKTNLPEISADELWFELDEEKFVDERKWLSKFCRLWEINIETKADDCWWQLDVD